MALPQVLELATAKRFIFGFVPTYFDVLGREFDRAWSEFRDGFPNPLTMAFAVLNFFTGVPFYPLYAIVENFGRAMLPNARYYRRFVITGEDAFKLCTEITTKVSFKAGLIDNTWQEQLIAWLASRLFTMVSGGGFISRIIKLIGVKSYDDVYNILKNSALKSLWLTLIRWGLVWFGVGYAMITMVAVGVYWNEWFQGLQQNNPRAWGNQRNRIRKKPSQKRRRASSSQGVRQTATRV